MIAYDQLRIHVARSYVRHRDSPDSLPTPRGQLVMPHRIPRSGQQDRSVQDRPEIPDPPHGHRFGKVPRPAWPTHSRILAILHVIRHGLDDSEHSSVVSSDLVVCGRRVRLEDGRMDVTHHASQTGLDDQRRVERRAGGFRGHSVGADGDLLHMTSRLSAPERSTSALTPPPPTSSLQFMGK
jgi:hypothetical protein